MNKVTVSLFSQDTQIEKQLNVILERFSSLQIKSICHDYVAVIDCFAMHTPDIWFVEIISEKDLNDILEIKPLPPFIVAISPDNLNIRNLLNRGIFDIIPMDFSMEILCSVIKKISHIINRYKLQVHELRESTMDYFEPAGGAKNYIFVNVKNRRRKIIFNKVTMIEKIGSSLKILIEDEDPIYYNSTLTHFLNRLPEGMFLRINGSTVVNINKVSNYSKNEIIINKTVKKITRQYAKAFFKVLET
jgi:DNA-binding LytR/AlgR family response regulator